MLSGFNTDVVFEQTVLHVQSEDRGEANPVLETLVYCGGQILHQERTEYSDCAASADASEEVRREIAARLERQHRDLVRRARHGEFLLDAARRFDEADDGEAMLETVQRILGTAAELHPLELTWRADMVAYGGIAGRLEVRRSDREGAPVPDVRVSARVLGCGLDPLEVFEGSTGGDGEVEVAVALPPAGATALLFRAEDGGAGGRLRVPLGTRSSGAGEQEEVDRDEPARV